MANSERRRRSRRDKQAAKMTMVPWNEPFPAGGKPPEPPAHPTLAARKKAASPQAKKRRQKTDTKTAVKIRTAPDERPPWLARWLANQQNSRLHRLPPELLAMVVDRCDFASQEMLRRTCCLFLRGLVLPPQDARSGMGWCWERWAMEERFLGRLPWPLHGTAREIARFRNKGAWDSLQQKMAHLCDDCRGFRRCSEVWPLLREPASNLSQFMAALFFWHESRQLRSQRALKARAMRKARKSGDEPESDSHAADERLPARLWCSGCHTPHLRILFSAPQRAKKHTDQRQCIAWEGKIQICRHHSLSRGQMIRREGRLYDSPVWSVRPSLGIDCECRRTAELSAGRDPIDERSVLISWRVPVMDLSQDVAVGSGTLPTSSPFTQRQRKDLPPPPLFTRRRLKDLVLSRQQRFAHLLCPHLRDNVARLLLPFELGQCACFDGVADERPGAAADADKAAVLDGKLSLFHQHPSRGEACCRCRSQKRPHLRGCFMPPEPRLDSLARYSSPRSMLADGAHTYGCSLCPARYRWIRSHPNTVYLAGVRALSLEEPCSAFNILSSIEPESVGWPDDPEVQGILWCADADCDTRRNGGAMIRRLGQEGHDYGRHHALPNPL